MEPTFCWYNDIPSTSFDHICCLSEVLHTVRFRRRFETLNENFLKSLVEEERGCTIRKVFYHLFFHNDFLVSSSIFAAGGVSVDILFDKSFYFPDDTMNLKILNVPKGSKKIDIVVSKGIEKMYKSSKENNQSEPIDTISISVPSDIGGYGLDVFIDGKLLLSRGFLVLSSWIQSPRYGF